MKIMLFGLALLVFPFAAFGDPTINQLTFSAGVVNELFIDGVIVTDIGSFSFVNETVVPFTFDPFGGEFDAGAPTGPLGQCCTPPAPNTFVGITFDLNATGTMKINGSPYTGPATLTNISLIFINSDASGYVTYQNYGTYPASFSLNYLSCTSSDCPQVFYPQNYSFSASNLTPNPEPSSMILMLTGLLSAVTIGLYRRTG